MKNVIGYGWPDADDKIWIPTPGNGCGGPHWDVLDTDNTHINISSNTDPEPESFDQQPQLIFQKVVFYSFKDEESFFEWMRKIDCIERISAFKNILYVYIVSLQLSDTALRKLIALCYCYNMDMTQLQIFLNDENRDWFCNSEKKVDWDQRVFEAKK